MDLQQLDELDEQLVWESAFILDQSYGSTLISDELRPILESVQTVAKCISTPFLVACVAVVVLVLGGTEIYFLMSDVGNPSTTQ